MRSVDRTTRQEGEGRKDGMGYVDNEYERYSVVVFICLQARIHGTKTFSPDSLQQQKSV